MALFDKLRVALLDGLRGTAPDPNHMIAEREAWTLGQHLRGDHRQVDLISAQGNRYTVNVDGPEGDVQQWRVYPSDGALWCVRVTE